MIQPTASPQRLLIVDPDRTSRARSAALACELGWATAELESAGDAPALLEADAFDAVLLARELPGPGANAALREIRRCWPNLPVVVVSAACGAGEIVQSLRAGARDFLCRPFDSRELSRALGGARRPETSGEADTAAFVAPGIRSRAVLRKIASVADTDLSVLICGESGTGKERVARALWAGSSRRDRPFVKVCCAALPGELFESELFGYEKGAFTGAEQRRKGKFQLAHTGTLFLDEVSELPPAMQAKLLQVLQDGQFARLGSEGDAAVDVRVIAATNADLDAAVASGRLREDLYYRLNVFSIEIPPLRERRDEILPLVEHFAARFARELGRAQPPLSAELRDLLLAHAWPGNVRELENVIKRLVVLEGDRSLVEELRERVARIPAPGAPGLLERFDAGETPTLNLKALARDAAQRAEAEQISRALERTRWNRREAAKLLQISYKALLYKMRDAGLADAPPAA
ncbi:MAG TPA: sigma-54 dependent transcriptional regulator [Myxococcota bacterium]|nr:sigma-54 dependent transcriptional regulator [Myxococcota bacterium]